MIKVVSIVALVLFVVAVYGSVQQVVGPCVGEGRNDRVCGRCVKIGRRGGCSACEASDSCSWAFSEEDPTGGVCVEKSNARIENLDDALDTDYEWTHRPDLCPLDSTKEPHIEITQMKEDVHVQTLWSHRQEDTGTERRRFCDFPSNNYVLDRYAHTVFDYTNPWIDSRGDSLSACYAAQTQFGGLAPYRLVVSATSGPAGLNSGTTGVVSWFFPPHSTVVLTADGLAAHFPCLGPGNCYGPEGAPGVGGLGPAGSLIEGAPLAALLARFATPTVGAWFVVGAGPVTVENTGDVPRQLDFAINDVTGSGAYANNEGSFNVYAHVAPITANDEAFEDAIMYYCDTEMLPTYTARGRECMRRMQAAYCSTACPEYGKAQGLLCNDSPHHDYLFRVCADFTNGPESAPLLGCPLDPNNLPWDDEDSDAFCDDDLLNVRQSGVFESTFGLFERYNRDDDHDHHHHVPE